MEKNHYDVIVVGAGVAGPALATGLARQNRRVLLIERDWKEPESFAGDFMTTLGVSQLQALGMVQALNNIDAVSFRALNVVYNGRCQENMMIAKSNSRPPERIKSCVFNGNDKILDDENFDVKSMEEDDYLRAFGFKHGRFVMNLRNIARAEKNVVAFEGTVTQLLQDALGIYGVRVKTNEKTFDEYTADLTFVCDGPFSRLRRVLPNSKQVPVVSQIFGITLTDTDIPENWKCNVLVGDDIDPVLFYQTGKREMRFLCSCNSPKILPNFHDHLRATITPRIPAELRKCFEAALQNKIKSHPTHDLPARKNSVPGVFMIGDSLNMRHPIGGSGMSIALSDVRWVVHRLESISNLKDRVSVLQNLQQIHSERKMVTFGLNCMSNIWFDIYANKNPYMQIIRVHYIEELFKLKGDKMGIIMDGLVQPAGMCLLVVYLLLMNCRAIFTKNGIMHLPLSIYQTLLVSFHFLRIVIPGFFREFFSQ